MIKIKIEDIDTGEIISLTVDPSMLLFQLISLITEQRGLTKSTLMGYISPQGSYFTSSQVRFSLKQLKIKNGQTLLVSTSLPDEEDCRLSAEAIKKALEQNPVTENTELKRLKVSKKPEAEWETERLECPYLVEDKKNVIKNRVNPENSLLEELGLFPTVLWELIMAYVDSLTTTVLILEKNPDKFASYFKKDVLKEILDSQPIQCDKLLSVINSLERDARIVIFEQLIPIGQDKLMGEWIGLGKLERNIADNPGKFLEQAVRGAQYLKLLLTLHYFSRIPSSEAETVIKQVYPLSKHPAIGKLLFNLSTRADSAMFTLAWEARHYEVISLLLQRNPELINSEVVAKIAQTTDVRIVELILEKKPSLINAFNFDILLSQACMLGYYELAALLLQKNPSFIHVKNKDWETPLITACLNQHFHLVPLLLHYKADVNVLDSFRNKTALHICISSIVNMQLHNLQKLQGAIYVAIRELLAHGADVNLYENSEMSRETRILLITALEFQECAVTSEIKRNILFNIMKFLVACGAKITGAFQMKLKPEQDKLEDAEVMSGLEWLAATHTSRLSDLPEHKCEEIDPIVQKARIEESLRYIPKPSVFNIQVPFFTTRQSVSNLRKEEVSPISTSSDGAFDPGF